LIDFFTAFTLAYYCGATTAVKIRVISFRGHLWLDWMDGSDETEHVLALIHE